MTDSKPEALLAWQIRVSNLPTPERNYKAIKGRKLEFDFSWPAYKLAIEVQGGVWKKGGHSSGVGINRDCEKSCLAQLAGWRLLPVTPEMIRSGKVVLWITEMMGGIR